MKNTLARDTFHTAVLIQDNTEIALPLSSRYLHVESFSPLQRKRNLFLKRSFDLASSTLLLVFFFSWLLPVIALLIILDSRGPVFFLQNRNKKGGRIFTCIKFRTMIGNSEADHLPACENDCRITRIGRFLRRHHLDELPQLLNVWWGDMSLIGPRPYMINDNDRYEPLIENYRIRHSVKPGITGLAQASGHYGYLVGPTEMKARLALDLEYIKNWSVQMDLNILYRTARMIFHRPLKFITS